MEKKRFINLVKYYFQFDKRKKRLYHEEMENYRTMTMEDLDYYFGKLKSRVAFHEEILNSLFPVLLLPIVPMSILAILVGIIKCVSIPVEEIFMFTFILWSIVFLWYEKYVIDLRIKVERVEKIVKERQILR